MLSKDFSKYIYFIEISSDCDTKDKKHFSQIQCTKI